MSRARLEKQDDEIVVERLEDHPSRTRWAPTVINLMGKVPDHLVARRAGVAVKTVQLERQRRGIKGYRSPHRFRWTREIIAALGTDTDGAIAAAFGLTLGAVCTKRRILGIPAYGGRPAGARVSYAWSRSSLNRLGKQSDHSLAKLLGVAQTTVRTKRVMLGIPPFVAPSRPVKWARRWEQLLGKIPDVELAKRMGCSTGALQRKRWEMKAPSYWVRKPIKRTGRLGELLKRRNIDIDTQLPGGSIGRLRREYGISAPPGVARRKWSTAEHALLGTAPDAEIARRLERTIASIRTRRSMLRIPTFGSSRRSVRGRRRKANRSRR